MTSGAEEAQERPPACETCGVLLEPIAVTRGSEAGQTWTPSRVAEESRKRFDGVVLCREHQKLALEARKVKPSTYHLLAREFDETFEDTRGGATFTYITGEQVASRLNEVLGPGGWSFRVLQHDMNQEADEFWALGEITCEIDGKVIVRQQFGSQKLKRSRSTGTPLDIGFDMKGAATDAMKKCATLVGVGLYLSHKDVRPAARQEQQAAGASGEQSGGHLAGVDQCEECGAELRETRFKDGTTWATAQLAGYGRRKHGRVLCMDHYRAANEARKSAVVAAS